MSIEKVTIVNTVDYKVFRDAIITLLRANAATLNSGLTSAANGGGTITDTTSQIFSGYPSITPVFNSQYPCIMVKISNKEEFNIFPGTESEMEPRLYFKIFGLTNYITSDIDGEIMQFAKNIEDVFRANRRFNSRIAYSAITTTGFGVTAGTKEGVYVNVVEINFVVDLNLQV